MKIGLIVLVLAFFVVALYCLLIAGSKSDDEMVAAGNEVSKEDQGDRHLKNQKTFDKKYAWSAVALLFIFAIVIAMYMTRAHNHDAEAESTTETTVTATTLINDILSETEETIHIDETEPTVDESTEPTSEVLPEAPSAPVTDEPTSDGELSELEMLAIVIYQEAGGSSSCDECRRYVADVVLNRVNDSRFPNTIYEVLTQRAQYGRLHWTGIVWPQRASNEYEQDSVARAYRIAEEVLSGQHSKLYGQGYIWQAEFVQGTDGFWCCGHFYGR